MRKYVRRIAKHALVGWPGLYPKGVREKSKRRGHMHQSRHGNMWALWQTITNQEEPLG